jgi:hypothetical protein
MNLRRYSCVPLIEGPNTRDGVAWIETLNGEYTVTSKSLEQMREMFVRVVEKHLYALIVIC